MAKKKTDSAVDEAKAEEARLPSPEQALVALADKCAEFEKTFAAMKERIGKLELKIDAVEKLSAKNRNYTAEEIFKVQNPFSK
jgi:hypothetical protein